MSLITDQALTQLQGETEALQSKNERICIITDTHLLKLYGVWLRERFPQATIHALPAGERAKTLEAYGAAVERLAEITIGRKGAIIGFGGGCVLDCAGFVAATYARGLTFYSVPTSLMAMVDAAIGGKNGLNLSKGKNLIGSFYIPKHIYIEPRFLETLPASEFNAGIAEVVKMALLGAPGLWDLLQTQPTITAHSPALHALLEGAMNFKIGITEKDPYDTALLGRNTLNLGHTFAHAIEITTRYQAYNHGEAVALGLCLCLALSEAKLGLNPTLRPQLEAVLKRYSLPTTLPNSITAEALLTAMARDKKAQAGRIRFIGIAELGVPKVLELSLEDEFLGQLLRPNF